MKKDNNVIRGGCWYVSDPARVRAAFRCTCAPAVRYDNLGFRCTVTISPDIASEQTFNKDKNK